VKARNLKNFLTNSFNVCIISLYYEKRGKLMRRHRDSSPKGVKENDLNFFLTNGFKVDIIYIQKQNGNKSNEAKEKINVPASAEK
tara:strand:- start:384 stop:638 length:255 start_codon:yes stop_codon:yes gene_type:complete